jgi:hypothetical protein
VEQRAADERPLQNRRKKLRATSTRAAVAVNECGQRRKYQLVVLARGNGRPEHQRGPQARRPEPVRYPFLAWSAVGDAIGYGSRLDTSLWRFTPRK